MGEIFICNWCFICNCLSTTITIPESENRVLAEMTTRKKQLYNTRFFVVIRITEPILSMYYIYNTGINSLY